MDEFDGERHETTEEAAEPASWKDALRRDFEAWLAAVDQIPESSGEEIEEPDLYSFFELLAAANIEARKANRRTAEAFGQWGDTLEHFHEDLRLFREQLSQRAAPPADANSLPRAYCLALIEILNRLYRMKEAFATRPASSWWRRADAAWEKAWETQRGAFAILVGHFEALIGRAGISRIDCLGLPFDPTNMAAVAAGPDTSRADGTVTEEFARGYSCRGEVLRAAQVKIVNNRNGERAL